MILDERLHELVRKINYPLVFVTISGAHLYGFPSADSDYDLRGVHVLPASQVVGLETGPDTIEIREKNQGIEGDVVAHDARKFFSMLLKRNGYVLEQLSSPLRVITSPEHDELVAMVPSILTRHHSHHYLGFAETQWHLFEKEEVKRVKPLLYVFRILLTGIHLMRTGIVEANLPRLNEEYRLPYVPALIARKVEGREKETLSVQDFEFYRQEYVRLVKKLEEEGERTKLPDSPSARPQLHDLLIRLRLPDHSNPPE